ncbi:unnamed protein product [Symbiodinium sp. CCMP2456]|nr:unnamed protein product [Symbiodinium sp. CCMP2456]
MRVDAYCHRASVDVIALQEVRADACTQRQLEKLLKERGWQVFWGGVAPPHNGTRKRGQGDFPGVALLVRSHLSALPCDCPGELDPWLHAGRLMALEVEGLVIFNLYAQSGHGDTKQVQLRHKLNEDLFTCAAHFEYRPVIAVGDWNDHVTDTPFALHTCMAGGTVRAGAVDERGRYVPTYVSGEVSSTIDGFILNKHAAPLYIDGDTAVDEGLQHRPLWLQVQAAVYLPSKRCLKPRKDLGAGAVSDAVSARCWAHHQATFLAACASHDVSTAWLIWSQCFEDILLESSLLCANGQCRPDDRGTRRGVTAETRCSNEYNAPMHQRKRAMTLEQRRLYKTQCQLRQLARGHLAHPAAVRTATKVIHTLLDLAPGLPSPELGDLLEPAVAKTLLTHLEKFCQRQCEQDKRDRIAAWKQRIRTDWSVDRARVFKWIRGENLEQIHAVFENGVLHRGAEATFAALRRFWVPVYALPADMVAQTVRAQPAQQYCLNVDPTTVKCQSGVDPEMLMRFNRRLKAFSAGGPDGWEAAQWKRMDLRTAGFLSLFLECCTQASAWPDILTSAHTVFIPKDGRRGVQDVSKLRPISVACLAYRAWAWSTLQKINTSMPELVHANQFGGVPGRTCADMYLQMQLELERVLVGEVPEPGEPDLRPHGYTEDSWKFFDTLQPPRIGQLLLDAGMCPEDVGLWLAFYAQHERIFRIGRTVDSVALRPERGVLQGCPLSLFASNLLMRRWCLTIEAVGAKPCAFVDDREVEAPDCATLQAAVDASRQFNRDEGLVTVLGAQKTFAWHASPPEATVSWGDEALPVQTHWTLLGTDMSATSQPCVSTRKARAQAMVQVMRRLTSLPLCSHERQFPAASAAVAKGIYGLEAHSIPRAELFPLRTCLLRVVWEGKPRRCPEAAVTMCFQGHVLDPEMAVHYASFCALRRALQAPAFMQQWLATWSAVTKRGCVRGHGPVREFRRRLRTLGWDCNDGVSFTVPTLTGPVSVDVLATPKPEFLHHVRNSLRVMLLKRAENRRKDFVGVTVADLDVTRIVLHADKHTLLRKSLQTLICGAITTQHVRHLAGLTPTAKCPFCDGDDEDVFHVLWSCPAWQGIRDDLAHLRLRPAVWPPAMRLCGYYVPSARHAPSAASWQAVQVVLARIIQARTQHLTRNNLFDERANVPEDAEAQDSKDFASTTHAAAEQDQALAASCSRGCRGCAERG